MSDVKPSTKDRVMEVQNGAREFTRLTGLVEVSIVFEAIMGLDESQLGIIISCGKMATVAAKVRFRA